MSPGCTPRAELVEKPVPVAVPVKDTPPAELLTCADRPDGLPEDPQLVAQMPTRLRAGVIRLARAYAAVAARLDRLINWTAPGTCAAAARKD